MFMIKFKDYFHSNRKFVYFISAFLIITFLALTVLIFGVKQSLSDEGSKIVNSNEFYSLKGNPTSLQRTEFDNLSLELDKELPDELKVAEYVAKSFVADYYTWNNKAGTYDIGGRDFIMPEEGSNFYHGSRLYYYSLMANYLNKGYSIKDLVEVDSISDNTADYGAPYDYYGTQYKSYYIELSWTYTASEGINIASFPTSAAITMIEREDGRIEVVRFY